MNFHEYVHTLRRGWLTLVTTALLGVAIAAAASLFASKVYVSTNEVFVSVPAGASSSSAGEVGQGDTAAQQKVQTYLEVVTSSRVLDPVIDRLDLPVSASELAKSISVSTPRNSVIIAITVADGDPEAAARIADAVAESFRTIVVDHLEATGADGTSPVKIETLQPASAERVPVFPRPLVNTVFGVVLGLVAGAFVVLIRKTIDTRVRSEKDLEALTDTPIIGSIGFDREAPSKPLIVHLEPHSHRAESFRSLRTNLKFVNAGNTTRSFVVTSALPAESKTTTSANLAITLAESGSRVIIVDADLRRPRLAETMGVEGAVGLTDVLIGAAEIDDVLQPWGRQLLTVMPAGQTPPNPSELLGSFAMQELLVELLRSFDYVVFDTPPILPVTDAAVLSRITDGAVFVAASGRSRRNETQQALAQLEHIGSRLIGVVLSMVPLRDTTSATPYTTYYGPDDGARRRERRVIPRRRRR